MKTPPGPPATAPIGLITVSYPPLQQKANNQPRGNEKQKQKENHNKTKRVKNKKVLVCE